MNEVNKPKTRNEAIQEMLTDGEQIKTFYRIAAQNPHLTLRAISQIAVNRPNATVCYSFEEWNAMDRRITRGSRGIPYHDEDGEKCFVFDAEDTHGEKRFQREVYPIGRLLEGLEVLAEPKEDVADGDYQKIHFFTSLYLNKTGYLSGEEEKDAQIIDGVAYSLYCKTAFPKSNNIELLPFTGTLQENADLFREVYLLTDTALNDVEDAYVEKQNRVQVIDDIDEDVVSDEIVTEVAPVIVEMNSASRSNYKGYVAFLRYPRESYPDAEVYLGKRENYDGEGHYDNTDGSLIYISGNRNVFSFLQGSGWTETQESLVKKFVFTEQDYKDFYEAKNGVLKDLEVEQEIKFGINIDKDGSGQSFRYPNWQDEKPKQGNPLYQRYKSAQDDYPKAVVVMRVGDFYEVMGENAKVIAEELDLTLTGRDIGLDERVPMCGFPYHVSDKYLDKILEKHSVLYVDGDEEPKYILSHAEVLEQSKKPKLEVLEEDELDPFDEQEEGEDDFDDNEDESVDEDEEEEKTKQVEKKKGKPIQQRKRKNENKPTQFSFFDIQPTVEQTVEERIKEDCLCRGSGFSSGKYRIVDKYMENPTLEDFASFVKDEYGMGGWADGVSEGMHDGKGFRFGWTNRENPDENLILNLSWKQVAEAIADYIDDGKYFTPLEQERFRSYYAQRHGSDEDRINAIATAMVEKGCRTTYSGNSIFRFNEFGNLYRFVTEHKNEIGQAIVKHEQVSDLEMDDAGFDINFYLDYCPKYESDERVEDLDEEEDEEWERRISSGELQEVKPKTPNLKEEENTNLNDVGFDQNELGGAKARYKGNIEAIKLMELLYKERRNPTTAEKKVLARYVGWGGLAQVFDENNPQWTSEYLELKRTLSPDDYELAKGSVLNAHYTSREVIDGIYKALERFGVKGNNRILEPSMGTGNFFGFMPQGIAENAKLYGVELDNITGRLATKLYPNANIQVRGFEQTSFPNDHFDIVVGNVPFGAYSVYDSEYAKYNFHIHDYFIAKSIDKLKPDGLMAVVTSKGTLDKINPTVRKYIADRAELVGAIRLPNTAFKQTAGTEVVADVLFLRKRKEPIHADTENTEWLGIGHTQEGYEVNNYFLHHPEMVLGTFAEERGLYGAVGLTVNPDGRTLENAFADAISHLPEGFYVNPEYKDEQEQDFIEADYNVKPLCYKVVGNKLYMREGDRMVEQPIPNSPKDAFERIVGMIALREELRHVLDIQTEGCSDERLQEEQQKLNANYDRFVRKYGYLNSQTNTKLFKDDGDSSLLFACENVSEDKKVITKTDVFTKRTIRPYIVPVSTDDCREALQISKNERGKVDIAYIEELTGKDYDTVLKELDGMVFRNPTRVQEDDKYSGFETSETYLSGDVKAKLAEAKGYHEFKPEAGYDRNVAALEKVQPEPIEASDIYVRLGASWVDPEYYKRFIIELLAVPYYAQDGINIFYNPHDSSWKVDTAAYVRQVSRVKITQEYGTERAHAYRLIEDSLNQRDTMIYDSVEENGVKRSVLNKEETVAARDRQTKIKEAFKAWIFDNPERREKLVETYNETFNRIRLPEYDGSYLRFPEMSPLIELKPHQKNAVHRIITSGNTLLHHVVGAGKTFTICAAVMKLRQYGLAKKPMIAVPNHLVQQWASEFRTLYPNAKLLVASKDDLEKSRRKKFVSKVAMGDWDAVIIAQSSFAKITISPERQEAKLREEIQSIEDTLLEAGMRRGSNSTIKNLERIKKSREAQLKKLMDDKDKDNVLIFENLGVDYLFIDEAHYYKNLFLFTKMNNVAGISSAASQRASDLKMKCEYINELHGGDQGVVFATGTPISNSMTEMYTMQSYLSQRALYRSGITFFDGWAANFGETVTSLEMAPSGMGYRAKTRFAKFVNLPELLTQYRSFADVQTSDMIKLDVPEVDRRVITLKPSDTVIDLAEQIAERAEKINSGGVDPSEDNMLKVTSDGKKLALDARLYDSDAPDEASSKLNVCSQQIYEVWKESEAIKGTQIVFCDLSTPKKAFEDYVQGVDFDVYNELKSKLVEMGIPEDEIAFIHEANTDLQKQALFNNVNEGKVRVLIGSTEKCGAGTNVQKRLIALHHLDTPYRPSDLQQREGRIVRQGNTNDRVKIFTYVTERTFDSYSYQILENKQRFISQIDKGDLTIREAEDIDEATLSYAEIKAITAANPKIKRKMEVDTEISRLRTLEAAYRKNLYSLQDKIAKHLPESIRIYETLIERAHQDTLMLQEKYDKENFSINVGGIIYTDRKDGGNALLQALYASRPGTIVAEYGGFKINIEPMSVMHTEREITLTGAGKYSAYIGQSASGTLTRLDNFMADFPEREGILKKKLEQYRQELEDAKVQVTKPFEHSEELTALISEQAELNAELNLNKREEVIIDDGGETPQKGIIEMEEKQTQRSYQSGRHKLAGNMLKTYRVQQKETPDAYVFVRNGEHYDILGEQAERIADGYDLPMITETVNGEEVKLTTLEVDDLDRVLPELVGEGYVTKIIEPIPEKDLAMLDENDEPLEEDLETFVDRCLGDEVWLNGRKDGFTQDEVEDLLVDMKAGFERSAFDTSSEEYPYDQWYDDFAEETLRPILEARMLNLDAELEKELDDMTVEEVEDLLELHVNDEVIKAPAIDVEWHLINQKKDYLKLVRESVEKEYAEFEKYELTRTPEQLMHEDNYKIRFFNELSGFIGDDAFEELYDRDMEALYKETPHILDSLYDYYLDSEYVSINNYGDTKDLIQYYNDRYHEDIVKDRYDFEGYRSLPEGMKFYGGLKEDLYYFVPDGLTEEAMKKMIPNTRGWYIVASPKCDFTREELKERKIVFLEIGKDIDEQAISHNDALMEMSSALYKKTEIEDKKRILQERMDCKKTIEQGIAKNFDGMHLNKGFEQDIIDGYGIVLVKEVLANTVQQKMEDGRFSRNTKEWANDWEIGGDEQERNRWVVDSHPAVLDGFINRILNYEKEELAVMPEKEEKAWLKTTVAKDALIQKYEKHSFMKMPEDTEYAGWTYNVFNNRIKEANLFNDLRSDSRELGYELSFREGETVMLKTRAGTEREISVDKFIRMVGARTAESYDRNNRFMYSLQLPREAIRGMYNEASLFVLPNNSEFGGFSYYLPNDMVKEDKQGDGKYFTIELPPDFTVTVRNKDKSKEIAMTAGEYYAQCVNTVAEQYETVRDNMGDAPESRRAEQEREMEKSDDDWHYVSVSKEAKVVSYKERSLLKMPKGKLEGYTYYIPNSLLKDNEENGTIRVSLPPDFEVHLKNAKEGTAVDLSAEEFISLVKDVSADGYGVLENSNVEKRRNEFEKRVEDMSASIPDEMKMRENWVAIRTNFNPAAKRFEKRPIDCNTGEYAEIDEPKTWTSFDKAVAYARENGLTTVAYALDGKDGIACIDLDHCINKDGEISDLAEEVLGKCGKTYIEHSVSKSGMHIFGKTQGMDLRAFSKDGDMEFYQKSHFIAMTGDGAGHSRLESFDTPEMKSLLGRKCDKRVEWKGTGKQLAGISVMSDREIVEKACEAKHGDKFKALYEGQDLQNNHSNSDMSLMNRLAYWCNGDKEQMLRIFATSGLYRPEKSPDYYEGTALKAIRFNGNRFNQPNPVNGGKPFRNNKGGSGK